MSNALAIAATLRFIAGMLDDGVTAAGLGGFKGSATSVLSPDQVGIDDSESTHLNLFLYLVKMNEGWKNVQLPSRNGDGKRIDRPPLALDLHFMLSAYGSSEYHQEMFLGAGMQVLHEQPFLDRTAIDTFLGTLTSNEEKAMAAAGLAAQVELVRIAPHDLSADELYKLWTAFGSKARPSAAYVASVVLIESKARVRAALPVLHANLAAIPFVKPHIEAVDPPVFELPIAGTLSVGIVGSGMAQPGLMVQFDQTAPVAPSAATPSRLDVDVPSGLFAGLVGVKVLRTLAIGAPPDKIAGRSDAGFAILRPAIASIVPVLGVGGNGTIKITARPNLDPKVRVDLLLDGLPGSGTTGSYVFTASPDLPAGAAVTFHVTGIAVGKYLVRIRTNGAESLPAMAGAMFGGPTVTVTV